MNFNLYIRKLKEIQDKCRLENGYSHIIYQVLENTIDDEKYSIIDTSSLKRTQDKATAPHDIIAVPDFVITNKDYTFDGIQNSENILGCIEVKYSDSDTINLCRLHSEKQNKGYLEYYRKVIYTNGWIWRYYNSSGKTWTINFRDSLSNASYGELIKLLCSIDWDKESIK